MHRLINTKQQSKGYPDTALGFAPPTHLLECGSEKGIDRLSGCNINKYILRTTTRCPLLARVIFSLGPSRSSIVPDLLFNIAWEILERHMGFN